MKRLLPALLAATCLLGIPAVAQNVPDIAFDSAANALTTPDDIYLGLRGLRTMHVRLRQHQENAIKVASWLEGQPEVARVLCPALPSFPGHKLWKRDFTGASGLFSVLLKERPKAAVDAFLDTLKKK